LAKVRNAYTTYQAKGNREDLSSRIYNIDPFDTPIFNSSARRNVTNRGFDWQVEKLPSPNGDNARQEGFELDRSPGTPTVRLNNVCQISSRDATVSGSQEAADAAGRPSEMGAQMALNGKALKRDMEIILSSAQAISRGDDADNPSPRRTRGLIHWLKTNAFVPKKNGTPVGALPASETDPYPVIADADRVEFTEDMVKTVMARAYDKGAEPRLIVLPPLLKQTFSGFKGRDSTQVLVGQREVAATVDVYVSDFGRVKALPSRWLDKGTALFLDPAYLAVAYYRTLRQTPIAKIGDAETRLMLAEWGVEMRNEAAHGVIVGLKGASNVNSDAIMLQAA
jgi:hypothetical protein